MSALELSNLFKSFGRLDVTRDVSLRLEKGARHALIGPNGAGKTTLVNLITGQLQPNSGRVILEGHDVTHLPVHKRAKLGLVRNFQITNLFLSFTVYENIALAVNERSGSGLSVRSGRGFPSSVVSDAEAIASRMGLTKLGNHLVRNLAYGQQRLVEIAVALALNPQVLILDEPAAGLPSEDHAMILDVVDTLPSDVAVMLIEHDMPLVFRFAKEITVLAEGSILATGTPQEIRQDPRVRAAYLGTRQ